VSAAFVLCLQEIHMNRDDALAPSQPSSPLPDFPQRLAARVGMRFVLAHGTVQQAGGAW
jgi:hypothetical protein